MPYYGPIPENWQSVAFREIEGTLYCVNLDFIGDSATSPEYGAMRPVREVTRVEGEADLQHYRYYQEGQIDPWLTVRTWDPVGSRWS